MKKYSKLMLACVAVLCMIAIPTIAEAGKYGGGGFRSSGSSFRSYSAPKSTFKSYSAPKSYATPKSSPQKLVAPKAVKPAPTKPEPTKVTQTTRSTTTTSSATAPSQSHGWLPAFMAGWLIFGNHGNDDCPKDNPDCKKQ